MLIFADPVVINLTGASGTLASPGYPDTYTNETDYKWIITVRPYNSVTLTFLDFETSCWQSWPRERGLEVILLEKTTGKKEGERLTD